MDLCVGTGGFLKIEQSRIGSHWGLARFAKEARAERECWVLRDFLVGEGYFLMTGANGEKKTHLFHHLNSLVSKTVHCYISNVALYCSLNYSNFWIRIVEEGRQLEAIREDGPR